MLTDRNYCSFCPAHWDDIIFSPAQGYVHGCCKSTPLKSLYELEVRRGESLNGIRPKGCEYCWRTEDAGLDSLRNFKLTKYKGKNACRRLTLTLNNLCNFQCVYCNEKYSSRWQTDRVKHGELELAFDHNVYYGGEPCVEQDAQVYVDFYNKMQPTEMLLVSGGEPLMGNILYDVLSKCDLSTVQKINVSTNLCYPTRKVIKKLLEFSETHIITLNVSLDTVDWYHQSRLRVGFDHLQFLDNLHYLLAETNVLVNFNSLMTDQTIFGIYKMSQFVYTLRDRYGDRITWFPSHCIQPRIHSFEVLNDSERNDALMQALFAQDNSAEDRELAQLNGIIAALEGTIFNEEVMRDQKRFFEQLKRRATNNIQDP